MHQHYTVAVVGAPSPERDAVADYLRLHGFRYTLAESAAAVVPAPRAGSGAARTVPPILLVVVGGAALLTATAHAVQAAQVDALLPIILVATEPMTGHQRAESIGAGADSILQWPISDMELQAAARALLRLRKSDERQRILAHMSAAVADSLDVGDTLERLASLVVDRLGDVALIDLMAADGTQLVGAVAKARRAIDLDAATRLLGGAADTPTPRAAPAIEAARTRQAVLFRDPSVEMLCGGAHASADDQAAATTLARTVNGLIAVPLVAHGRLVGTLTVGRSAESRALRGDDCTLIGELATRAALAVDHAALHRAARLANEAKAKLLTVMSHELRTPLNVITGYTELLADEIMGPCTTEQQEALARISGSSGRLLALIDDILAFARAETGRDDPQLTTIDVGALLQDVASLILPQARQAGLAFHLEMPPGVLHLQTDGRRVRQALLNILLNAIKFTPAGSVSLTFEATAAQARFLVHDTGVGMSPEEVARAFDPFWQAETDLVRRTKGGTGMGLSVVRSLVASLGGTVALESVPGRGTTVTIVVPGMLAVPSAGGTSPSGGSPARVTESLGGRRPAWSGALLHRVAS